MRRSLSRVVLDVLGAINEALRESRDFTEWEHYPLNVVHDPKSHTQYYFHARSSDDRNAPALIRARTRRVRSQFRAPAKKATCTRHCHAQQNSVATIHVYYPAQQESFVTSLSKVCAASFSPSTVVRYGKIISARSSIVSF